MLRLNNCRKLTLSFVSLALALAAGVYIGLKDKAPGIHPNNPNSVSRPAIETLYAARLPDHRGQAHLIGDWRGKTLVVNFWAAWCQPCREEMPAFARLQKKYASQGVQFVGIAIDNAKNVSDFSERMPVGYPLLIAETEGGELMRRLGNVSMGLPYTVVLHPDGSAALVQLGRLSEQTLDTFLQNARPPKSAADSGQVPAH